MTNETTFHVGDQLKPATEEDAARIGSAFTGETTTERIFEVLLVVKDGLEVYGGREKECEGVIVKVADSSYVGYPFVWASKRWIKVGHRQRTW